MGRWVAGVIPCQYQEGAIGLLKGNETLHTTFANLTVPALALSILLLIVTTAMATNRRQDSNARNT